MICLGLVIGIILIILGFCIKCFSNKKFINPLYHADLDEVFKAIGAIILVIAMIIGLILCAFYTASGSIIDKKITMYEEENIKKIIIFTKKINNYQMKKK